jgi:phage-related protein
MSRGTLDLPIVSKFDKTGLKKAQDAFGGFGKQLAGIAAGIAAAFSVRAITRFAKESVAVAEEAATAQARLEAVAKATGVFGDATDDVTKRLADFAKSQEMLIATDDVVIKGVQAKLLSFKALSESADEAGGAFDRATVAAFDMAAAGFGSAEGNAVALGKALENPIKGISALSRTGTVFTEEQKEQIRVLQESGDLLGAQEIILSELESQYGGVAEATADASDKLDIAFKNIKESAGAALLPVFAELVEGMLPVLELVGEELAGAFEELAPVLTDLAGQVPKLLQAFIPMIPALGAIAGLFLELIAKLLPPFVELFDKLLPIILELVPILADAFLSALEELFPVFFTLIDALIPIVEALLPVLVEIIRAAAPIVVKLIQAFMPLLNRILPLLIRLIDDLLPIGLFLAELLGKIIIGAVDLLITGFEKAQDFFTNFGAFFETLWTGIRNFFARMVNGLIGMFEGFVNSVVTGVNFMIRALNRLKVKIPDFAIFGALAGQTFGFNIPEINRVQFPKIPMLADGGIVDKATLAMIGESGPEAVVPLDRMGSMGGATYNITVNAGFGTNGPEVAEQIVRLVRRYERNSGPVFARA